MAPPAYISYADLARYWGCSAANVSILAKKRAMPRFSSLREADAWRALNAPIRKLRQTALNAPFASKKSLVESGEKIVAFSNTTTPPTTPQTRAAAGGQLELTAQAPASSAGEGAAARIDVSRFVDPGADFVELQLRNAKELSQITYGLLRLRTEEGEPNAIAAASRNWHETAKAAADVIDKYLVIQRETGNLITLDEVADVVLTELEEIRKGMARLGRRVAAAANPDNPALAEQAINAGVDRLLEAFNAVPERARLELAPDTP